ncbi:MAG: SIR2 family protein [Bacteroidota bacterium]
MEQLFTDLTIEELRDKCREIITYIQENVWHNEEEKVRYNNAQIAYRMDTDPIHISRIENGEYKKKETLIQKIEWISKEFNVGYTKDLHPIIEKYKQDKLEMLSDKLSINLIDVSTMFKKDSTPHLQILKKEKAEKILSRRKEKDIRERYVVFIGIDASHAATDGFMPRKKDAKKKVEKLFSDKGLISKKLLKAELERLEQAYRLNKDDFETQLLAISRFSRKDVIEALKVICEVENVLSAEYEILAHMLKHRFFDAIVNFNYDEILDDVIKEEINEGDFAYIFSASQCPEDYKKLLVDNRLRQPVYIKPHGTISHRSSLRFTREEFLSIPTKLMETIQNVLAGKLDGLKDIQKQLPLNLIVIGHSILSFDFTILLSDYLKSDKNCQATIWIFNEESKRDEIDKLKEILSKKIQKGSNLNERVAFYFFPLTFNKEDVRGDAKPLMFYLTKIWNFIQNNFEEPYAPKGIERHLLTEEIFKPDEKMYESLSETSYKKSYLRSRFYVELMISFLNSDGILNTKQILEGRAGKFFRAYQDKSNNVSDGQSLEDACRDLNLFVYKDFVRDAFTLKTPSLFHNKKKLVEEAHNIIAEKVDYEFKSSFKNNETSKTIKELLYKIANTRSSIKITTRFIQPHDFLFRKVSKENILNTLLNWNYKLRQSLERDDWDLMLAVSEKGYFLNDFIKEGKHKNKKFELILSSFDTDEFRDLSSEQESTLKQLSLLNENGKLLALPWYLHNRHLVLTLKKLKGVKKENGKPWNYKKYWKINEGFYYESRMLSRRANPVHIKHYEDLEILLEIFTNYWYRAKFYSNIKPKEEKSIPIISSKDKLDELIGILLKLYDKRA